VSDRDLADATKKLELSYRQAKVAETQQETQQAEPVSIQCVRVVSTPDGLRSAQDSLFRVICVSNLLADTQHYTRFISAAKGRILKLALLCSLLLIVELQIS
jgi:hypothetical protein